VVVDEGLYAELEKIVIERFGALPKAPSAQKQVAHTLAAEGLKASYTSSLRPHTLVA